MTKINKRLNPALPQDIVTERAVLSLAMRDQTELILNKLISGLKEKDFFDKFHRLVFATMLSLQMKHERVDFFTINNQLAKHFSKGSDYTQYLDEIIETRALRANLDDYLAILLDKSRKRQVIASLSDVVDSCIREEEELNQLIDRASKELYEIKTNQGDRGLVPFGDVVEQRIYDIQKMLKGEIPDQLKSGYPSLDKVLGGLRKGALMIIASRPGMGKSAFAFNIAYNAAHFHGASTALFCLEMSNAEVADRIISTRCNLDFSSFKDSKMTDAHLKSIVDKKTEFKQVPLSLYDGSILTTVDIMSKCRQMQNSERGLDLIVIDYLQLMTSTINRSDNRQLEISEISRNLKIMARELDVPVIALSQLSRSCESRKDKRPQLSDLRDSGAIEQDADSVMFLYREAYYAGLQMKSAASEKEREELEERAMDDTTELAIAKNRHGETRVLFFGWNPSRMTFYEKLDDGYVE